MEKLRITVNGRVYTVRVEVLEDDGDESYEDSSPRTASVPSAPPVQPLSAINGVKADPPTANNGTGIFSDTVIVKSPMPGTILDIKVSPGDKVKRGQVLITLEAMKMENELMAERDGIIEYIHVSKGQSVQAGEKVITLTY